MITEKDTVKVSAGNTSLRVPKCLPTGRKQSNQNPSCTPRLPLKLMALSPISKLRLPFKYPIYLCTGPNSEASWRRELAFFEDAGLVLGTKIRIYAVAMREVMLKTLISLT